MIKSLLKLLIVMIIGILIYNYFFGTKSEKEGAQKIFKEFKDVGIAVSNLLKTEKEKFDAGKYDKAVDKIGDTLDGLKKNAKEFDEKYLDRIEVLEQKRKALQEDLEQLKKVEGQPAEYDEFTAKGGPDTSVVKRDLEKLLQETEQLIKEMQSGQ